MSKEQEELSMIYEDQLPELSDNSFDCLFVFSKLISDVRMFPAAITKRIAELEADINKYRDEVANREVQLVKADKKFSSLHESWEDMAEYSNRQSSYIRGLEAEFAEQIYIIAQFGEWYSDNGCPVTETKERFCPDLDGCRAEHEKENLKLAEEDRFEFDSEDCETINNCGKCYAEYYRMKYRKSLKPITLPEAKELTFLPDCKWQRKVRCVTYCTNLHSVNFDKACDKNCANPEPKEQD